MKKAFKNLLIFFTVIVIVKTLIASLTSAPSAFSDNYNYLKIAWSIYHNNSILVNEQVSRYPFFYSFILSIAYIFSNMNIVYFVMKFINAFVSSLAIFPVYLICKDFINRRSSFIIAALTAFIAPHFLFPNYIMAENLFFPLFAFSIYFLYLAFRDDDKIFFILAGVFSGLGILTRMNGVALIPVAFLAYLFFRKSIRFKNIILHYIALALVFMPYFIWLNFYKANSILGYPTRSISLMDKFALKLPLMINWHINYIGYLGLAIGAFFLIYFIAGFFVKKDYRLKVLYVISSLSGFFLIFLAADHCSLLDPIFRFSFPFTFYSYRPLGRYIAAIFPFVMLLGFILYKKDVCSNKMLKWSTFATILIFLISSQMTLSPLFPVNNISLTFVGLMKYIVEYLLYAKTSFDVAFHWGSFLIIASFFTLLPFVMFKLRKTKIIIPLLFLFLVMNIFASYTIHIWNVETYWANNDHDSMGKWVNNNIEKDRVIMIDTRHCGHFNKNELNDHICAPDLKSSLVGIWIINPIEIGNPYESYNADYLITMESLDYSWKLEKNFGNLNLYSKIG